MKKCKHCQSEIDDKAKVCPNCRKKQTNPVIKAICIFFGIMLVFGGLATIFGGTDTETTVKEDEGCYMTIEKFNQINTGMTYEEVKNVIGCDGKLSTESSAGDQSMKVYYWYAKNGVSNATFSFYNNELSAKSQIGLE